MAQTKTKRHFLFDNISQLLEDYRRETEALLEVFKSTKAKCPDCNSYLNRDFSCSDCGFVLPMNKEKK
jgi:tRNA(Ile2) C34 agmatinyltransferase TiaS